MTEALNSEFLQSLASNQQAIVLLLTVPFVAMVIGVARHIVGIKSLGIYASIVLTYALYGLGLSGDLGGFSDVWDGIRYGIIFMTVLIGATVLASTVLRKARMHYFPKISIVISFSSLALLATILLADLLGKKGFSSTNALAIVMIVSVAEQFTTILFKLKLRKAIMMTIESTVISLFCYVLIAWPSFQEFIIRHPYSIVVAFFVSYLVGKYRGLRVTEYLRFRELLDNIDGEN